jgi:hypothetical protein
MFFKLLNILNIPQPRIEIFQNWAEMKVNYFTDTNDIPMDLHVKMSDYYVNFSEIRIPRASGYQLKPDSKNRRVSLRNARIVKI